MAVEVWMWGRGCLGLWRGGYNGVASLGGSQAMTWEADTKWEPWPHVEMRPERVSNPAHPGHIVKRGK